MTEDTSLPQEKKPLFAPEDEAYLDARAVPLDYAAHNWLRSFSADEVANALGKDPAVVMSGALAIPYTQTEAPGTWRLRMHKPSKDDPKFLVRAGERVRPYLAPEAWTEDARKNTKLAVSFVEGPIKALSLCAAGFLAVGLAGCEAGGHDKDAKEDGRYELHPDLAVVEWKNRKVIIVMDAGRAWNDNVRRGEETLARCLKNAGARVFVAALPPRDGKEGQDQGPDDFIKTNGAGEFGKLVEAATEWKQSEPKEKSTNGTKPGKFAKLVIALKKHVKLDRLELPGFPQGKGILGFNEMTAEITIDEIPVIDPEISALRFAFAVRGLNVSQEDMWSALALVARDYRFHPVRRYLDKLRWDGEPRLDRAAKEIFHAKGDEERQKLNAKLVRIFFIAAVARAYEPGCKVDSVLTVAGAQGSFKSTTFKRLAGEGWFCDSDLDIGDTQTTPMIMGRAWLCEWAELESLKRAREATQVKSFISRATDLYRPPYARAPISHPRSSVIVATTNEEHFLNDSTGNRRFHTITVDGRIDIAKVEEWRDQLWAEAAVAYRAGEHWWLDDAEEGSLLAAQEQHFAEHPWTNSVYRWLTANHQSAQPLPVTTENILVDAIDKEIRDHSRRDQMEVANILKRWGWSSADGARVWAGGKRVRVWLPPQDWDWGAVAPADNEKVSEAADTDVPF